MKLAKVIEILQDLSHTMTLDKRHDENDAVKLGIEALKSVRTGRKVGLHYEAKCLPGETE